ncbi:haloalkane dehalogenase [Williamsia phyllosphaerae]|uniref:Haloalkane dehalogenase 1 n=1 Tax=Williamsia phyllosphaerae TaxID=885042 RepID=A0ABQ1UCC2_9NOCA|nr:haloalkane dehalogenase [Williamsia phyllosphaerae]GGF15761.1 haloalkane dehalogenase 1 [Williamsia phyllosphaerae]
MDVYRTPDERFADLPGWHHEPRYLESEGLRIHHVDVGSGDPIVLFHGEPTWSYLYRKMIGPLADAGNRVIAYDHAGFGRSDKPTDRDWYSYDRHSAIADDVLDQLQVTKATVVVQDWGGPIGLRWAVEHADRVDRIVIMNTGLFTGRVSRGFLAWRDFAEKNPDLPVGTIVGGGTATDVPADVIAAYDAPFPTAGSKAGAAQFPLIVPVDESAAGAAVMARVADELSRWNKPALLAFSDSDPVFPHPRSGQAFIDLMPTVDDQVTITGAAHFLQEDRGEHIADEIIAWMGS